VLKLDTHAWVAAFSSSDILSILFHNQIAILTNTLNAKCPIKISSAVFCELAVPGVTAVNVEEILE
jgi:hypothetical protein